MVLSIHTEAWAGCIDLHMALRCGVDVGGTHTDAALVSEHGVLATAKVATSEDVLTGIRHALQQLEQSTASGLQGVSAVMIGTTRFVNAVVQQQQLARVFVIRLCGPATSGLPPWTGLPPELAQHIAAGYLLADGGYECDGMTELAAVSADDAATAARAMLQTDAQAAVVCGVHSPVNPQQEEAFAEQLRQQLQHLAPGRPVHLTLSHKLSGRLGLLEREAASILNASLQPLAAAVVPAYEAAVRSHAGLASVPVFITANDGTLLTAAAAQEQPLLTLQSGPVNSMRGAAYLAGLPAPQPGTQPPSALVVDIGGTTTDVGFVHLGQPRMSGTFAEIAGVLTNLQVPDIFSIGLGGGSLVLFPGREQQPDGCQLSAGQLECRVGPGSVGCALTERSLVCGGNTFTASDVAVLLHDLLPGLCSRQQYHDRQRQAAGASGAASHPSQQELHAAWDCIQAMLAAAVDAAAPPGPIPVVVVGGGAALCSQERLPGASAIIHPPHAAVANAVGAAMPQVAGVVDTLVQLAPGCASGSRQQALDAAVAQAKAAAVAAGAEADSCVVVEQEEVPVAYGPPGSTRLHIKVVGQLQLAPEAVAQSVQLAPGAAAAGAHTGAGATASTGISMQPAAAGGAGGPPSAAAAASLLASDDTDSSRIVVTTTGGDRWTLQRLLAYRPCVTAGGWEVSDLDLDALAIGAQVLGAGGGGSARHCRLKLHNMMSAAAGASAGAGGDQGQQEACRPAMLQLLGAAATDRACARSSSNSSSSSKRRPLIISLQALPDNTLLCDVGGMGAPTVSSEKLDSHECSSAVRALSTALPGPITALLCAEVGGGNALEPLAVGMELSLPVVDADLMGRAFPEVQMTTAAIAGVPLTPAALADDKGNALVMAAAASPLWAEKVLRAACTEMGSTAGLASSPMDGRLAKQVVVPGSLSLAWRLGMAVLAARAAKRDPVAAALDVYQGAARLLLRGKVVGVQRDTSGGFATGHVRVEPLAPGDAPAASDQVASGSSQQSSEKVEPGVASAHHSPVVIEFQNEALAARADGASGRVLASVPDLICILESGSGAAVATEDVRFGLLVSVVVLPAHPLLRTPAALRVVGPAAFGLGGGGVQYEPVGGFPVIAAVHEQYGSS